MMTKVHEIGQTIPIGAIHAVNNSSWELMSLDDKQLVHEMVDHSQGWDYVARYYSSTYEDMAYKHNTFF